MHAVTSVNPTWRLLPIQMNHPRVSPLQTGRRYRVHLRRSSRDLIRSRAGARSALRCVYQVPGRPTLINIYPRSKTIIGERESAADGGTSCAAEESPSTGQTRSRTQVRVARVTAMTQKRHGPPSVMKRSSPHTAGERRGFIPVQLVERSGGKR